MDFLKFAGDRIHKYFRLVADPVDIDFLARDPFYWSLNLEETGASVFWQVWILFWYVHNKEKKKLTGQLF